MKGILLDIPIYLAPTYNPKTSFGLVSSPSIWIASASKGMGINFIDIE